MVESNVGYVKLVGMRKYGVGQALSTLDTEMWRGSAAQAEDYFT